MIHKFSLFGTNIVVDVNSGAVHVVDDVTFDILDYYQKLHTGEIKKKLSTKHEEKDIAEALGEIKSLEENGLLYSEDTYKKHIIKDKREPVVKALCLHICHDCNLRCKYCFASTGDFGGERTMMSLDVGKKAIDFLLENSQGRRNLEIDFFGGEPTMNFDVVKGIVEYAQGLEKKHDKNFRFTLTTNGLLLDEEKIKYINENMCNVVLSIDGRKDVNDKMRCRVDGTGCYDNILPKYKRIAELREQDNYYVRGTFTRENLDFSNDVIHLADQGFKQISVEPVVVPEGCGFDLRKEDLSKLYKEYETLAWECVKRDKEGKWFNFFHFMIDLTQGPCVIKRLSGCGSGCEYLAITPEGDIYPCHQFVGEAQFKMGSVWDGVLNEKTKEYFQKSNVYTKEDCMNCWAKFYCSGGCAANAYHFNNDINTPYKIGCELQKKRVECALWIKAQGV